MQVERRPILNSLMRWFLFTMVLANTAGHMHMTLLPLYLRELGASVAQVGLAFTMAAVVPLALQILGGWVSDSLGRLRTIALGSVGGVLSYIALVLAPSWQWVVLALGLGAIARSMVGPSFGAFIAEQSDEANRGKAFGVSEGIFMLVAVIGPPLGGILAERYGFKLMFLVAGALYGSAAVLRFWMASLVRRTSEAHTRALSLQSLRASLGTMVGMALAGGLVTWILVTDGARDVAGTLSFDLLPVYLEDVGGVSVEGVGWLTSIFGVAVIALTLPSGWLADRRGERFPIALGFALQSLSLFVMISVRGFFGYAVSWALFGFGTGLMNPAFNSLISKAIPEKLRGTAFGLLQTSIGLFSLPSPYIGAQLWERLNPQTPFMLTALGLLGAVVPAWMKFKPRQEASRAPEPAEAT